MSRSRKTAPPEPAPAEAQAVVYEANTTTVTLDGTAAVYTVVAGMANDARHAPPPEPRAAFYSVGVRNRCPWSTIQSAGSWWSRASIIIPGSDSRLDELQRCDWLLVAPVEA